MALPYRNRLNLRFHRRLLASQGVTHRTPFFTFIFSSNSLSYSRYAVLLSRKFSPLAVTRNRFKRIITDILRLHLHDLPSNQDILIIPQKKALSVSPPQLSSDLLHQLRHLPQKSSPNHQSQSDHEKKHTPKKNR